ncbi:E2-like enzyme, partial [Gonapodya sp. JEL0774]
MTSPPPSVPPTTAPPPASPSVLTSLYNSAHSALHAVRQHLAPLPTESSFSTTGTITPDEFVRAGDFLVDKCPTWHWAAGAENKRRHYLPSDKQYLVTRQVPCRKRVWEIEQEYGGGAERILTLDSVLGHGDQHAHPSGSSTGTDPAESTTTSPPLTSTPNDDQDDWVETHVGHTSAHSVPVDADIDDTDTASGAPPAPVAPTPSPKPPSTSTPALVVTGAPDRPHIDDIPDIEDELDLDPAEFGLGGVQPPQDAGTLPTAAQQGTGGDGDGEGDGEGSGNILKTRTYDISITYDAYYRTPRLYLSGYSPSGTPLPPLSIFADVSADHAHKTVTVEAHPHEAGGGVAGSWVGVHPCRHAAVMKRVVQLMAEREGQGNGEGKGEVKVEWYMMVFLK